MVSIGVAGCYKNTYTSGNQQLPDRLNEDFQPIDVAGIPGEICGKGPHAMIMYFKEPEKTETAMRDGWFHSGDIGVLDDDRYIAVVVPRKGETITEDEIIDLCRKELAGLKVPKSVVFVDALPKIPTGKILKRDMRDTYSKLNC